MIFRQIIHEDLGSAAYLVGDEGTGRAALVDPALQVDEYLRQLRYAGLTLEHIVETHTHADRVSGHGQLAAATGATIHIHRIAGVEYEHEPFEDGWELELGRVVLRALHTPGHRPEHTSFLVTDRARGDEPWAVLTGDALFVADIGRPDLAVEPEEGARDLFSSLHDKLLTLPPYVEVWPGHLGGSLCGGPGMDRKVSSTIGYEREHNPVLAHSDRDRFVADAIDGLAPQPPRFERIVRVNSGPLQSRPVAPGPLSPRQLEARRDAGALVVDVRTDQQFDDAHIPGAVSNTALRAGFGTKLAWLVEEGQEVVLVGRDDHDALAAADLAASVDVTAVSGYLAGGMTSWREDQRPVERIERIDIDTLHERWEGDQAPQVLDVRDPDEWEAGHLPGSLHRPYHAIHAVPDGLDPDRPVAVLCASGQRAGVGASLLQHFGVAEVAHVAGGGVGTWERRGWPVER
ncbi:MAG TPA: MBL fold metallo-hydrolase [Thermoleophilaceae bacterium]|nr:MBL fold metallo-hydrolase [Thermoleophilaceae bacterium]